MVRSGKIAPALLLLAAVVTVAYGISTVVGAGNSVSGQVIAVESASVTVIQSLTLEDDSGKRWTFQGSGAFTGFTPSHLLEHRALQETVTVKYEVLDSGDLVILEMSD